MSILVGKFNDDGVVEFVGGAGGFRRDQWFLKNGLEEGKYFVTIVNDCRGDKQGSECDKISVWTYGVGDVQIQRISQLDNIRKSKEIFHGLMADYVRGFFEFFFQGEKSRFLVGEWEVERDSIQGVDSVWVLFDGRVHQEKK
jgi:hypothetical protein